MEDKGMKEVNEGVGDFNVLPEGCISGIISLTSPQDACTCCLVSSVFRSAAESDSVWEKFIPSDHQEILASSSSSSLSLVNFSSKKDLYYSLCHNPILIDGGLKSFYLEKHSGKKCFMLGAKDLTITWGSAPPYWEWRSFPGSRFADVAALRDVCWLYIEGKMGSRFLSPNTSYAVCFIFRFVDGAYGFNDPPAKVIVEKLGEGGNIECRTEKEICLDPDGLLKAHRYSPIAPIPRWEQHFGHKRSDGWFEIEMGHFFNNGGEDDGGEVHMTLKEIAGGNWKSGLIVEGMELRPKENI